MRPVKEITSKEENFRFNGGVIKRDPIKPEPEGTIILMAFRIDGYDQDCDGSLMARIAHIDKNGEESGWCQDSIGVYPNDALVVTPEELKTLFDA